jgi:hypothetical protein
MLLLIISVINQCLLLRLSPYESKRVNWICFFNEVAVSLNLYLSLLLTDYLSQQLRDNDNENEVDADKLGHMRLLIAWIITALLMTTISINFIHTVTHLFASLLNYLKSKGYCCCTRVATVIKATK